VLLICERCHRYWKLPRGHKRRNSCPRCQWLARSRGATKRERLRQIAIETPALARPVTSDELLGLMQDADRTAARALDAARRIMEGKR
jgi:hypothetical protein